MNLFLILSISFCFLPTGNCVSSFRLKPASKIYNSSFSESETKKISKKSKDPLDFNWECLFIDCEKQNTKNITTTQNLNDGDNCKSNSECISSFCNNDHVCFTPLNVKKLNLGDNCKQNNDCSDTFVCLEDPNHPEYKICQANKTTKK